jgi:hypothetical protein
MEAKIVYVLESGEYSDRRIEAVYDDEELAEKAKERWDADDCRIHKFYLNESPPPIPIGYTIYKVKRRPDGNFLVLPAEATPDNVEAAEKKRTDRRRCRGGAREGQYLFETTVFAKNQQHAQKIAADRFAAFKAALECLD